MPHDPLARLNLPRAVLAPPPEPAAGEQAPEAAGVPAFPAEPPASSSVRWATASAPEFPPVVADSRASLTVTAPPSAPATPLADVQAAMDQARARPQPPVLSDLDRYRLEQDRELLRRVAYRRHFLNREE